MKMIKLILPLIGRTIRWMRIKLYSKNNEFIKDVNGYKLILKTDKPGLDLKEDSIFKQLAMDGIREKEATRIIEKIIKPGEVIFELGANIGYYAILEARLTGPNGHIYAIEPEDNNVELLKRNIALNNITNISVEKAAVSDKVGTFPFYISTNSNLHSMIRPTHGEYQESSITTTTVDEYLKGKRPVSYLRMDIEGYEYYAIKGMQETLAANREMRIFIELHTHLLQPEQSIEILQNLKSHGFEILTAITHDNKLRSIIGDVTVEQITIDQLCKDERLLQRKHAFEIFFEKR